MKIEHFFRMAWLAGHNTALTKADPVENFKTVLNEIRQHPDFEAALKTAIISAGYKIQTTDHEGAVDVAGSTRG